MLTASISEPDRGVSSVSGPQAHPTPLMMLNGHKDIRDEPALPSL